VACVAVVYMLYQMIIWSSPLTDIGGCVAMFLAANCLLSYWVSNNVCLVTPLLLVDAFFSSKTSFKA